MKTTKKRNTDSDQSVLEETQPLKKPKLDDQTITLECVDGNLNYEADQLKAAILEERPRLVFGPEVHCIACFLQNVCSMFV